ncbi:MAG TPA: hypothetical protein VF318_09280, partial [Dehalococcoidales bacterium]
MPVSDTERKNVGEGRLGGDNTMTVPLDAIRAIHNAFRKEMKAMDESAFIAARGRGNETVYFLQRGAGLACQRRRGIRIPSARECCPAGSRSLPTRPPRPDGLFESLDKAVKESDRLAIARTTAAFDFHLSIHLDKEEAHLYRIFNERVPLPEQGVIGAKMSQ